MFVSHVLVMYVPLEIFNNIFTTKYPNNRRLVFYTIRTVMILCCVLVAVAVPNLVPLMGLVGSVCSSNLGLICPALIECFTYYYKVDSLYKWRLVKNITIIVIGLMFLVFGSYKSIIDIVYGK